jgi:glycosyltransferase involved in cell wall biosynthesis
MREKRAMMETVIRELRPDYLTMENEPDTQARNTGLDFSLDNYIRLINAELSGLDRRGVAIGAGAGTWSKTEVFEALAKTDIDYIDVHIYPINGNLLLPKLEQISRIARQNRKPWRIGEAWLYKTDGAGYGDYQETYKRDAYRFWSPLDERFIRDLPELAGTLGAQSVNYFWVTFCFGNLDYSPELEARATREIMRRTNEIAGPNLLRFELTPVGRALRETAMKMDGDISK